ncbi:ABC transporter ATP-binding protein [Rickettsiales bacterium LUAb2]
MSKKKDKGNTLKKFKALFTTTNLQTIKRLWKLALRKYMIEIVIVIILMITFSAANAGSLGLLKTVMDKGFIGKDFSALKIVSLEIVALFIIKAIALYANTYLLYRSSIHLSNEMRSNVFKKLMKLDINFYENNTSGLLVTRIVNDCIAAGELLRQLFTVFLTQFFTVLALLVVMIYQAPKLALISLVLVPIIFYLVRTLNKKIRAVYTNTMSQTENIFSYLTQIFQNMPIVKIYARERYEEQKSDKIFNHLAKLQKKTYRIQSMSRPIIEILTGIVMGAAMFGGGYLITKDIMTPGSFMVFFTAIFAMYTPLKQMVGVIPQIQTLIISAERVFLTYDAEPKVKDKDNAIELTITKGEVEFKNVNFKYEGIEKNALNNISFKINPGELLALVGPSGAGKSTIVKLVSRFYDINGGSITIDGQNIADVTQDSLHKYMSMVTQDVFLFDDSIRNNIAYGSLLDPEDVPFEDIVNAAKKADAYDFIMTLPNGFDTTIGERGVKLSGGQKQRLSIARAILKNSPILLLDEATSALDTESERAVQHALYELMQDRTTIVIAHRLSTIVKANRILVIENGTLIEEGTHDELLNKSGRYKDLYKIQFNH